jgi:hypothetical protein
VVTQNWQAPNSFNSQPLNTIGSGRGSLVLYNQGSAFLYKLTGEKNVDDAVLKYGGYKNLAAAMAAVAQTCLSPSHNPTS